MDVRAYPWVGDGVVLLGDAGHGMSPQLGQGVNLGLVDAYVLANCLENQPGDLRAALGSYTQRRRNHLFYYQMVSRWLTPLFQSGIDWLAWLRDPGFAFAMKVSPLRQMMVRSMMGRMMVGSYLPDPKISPSGNC